MAIRIQPNEKWVCTWRDEYGKQCAKTFAAGPEGKKQAEAHDLKVKAEKKLGGSTAPPEKLMFDDLAEQYLADRRNAGVSESFQSDLKSLLNGKVLPNLARKPLEDLTYNDMMKVMALYSNKSIATKNRYTSYLRSVFMWGQKHGIIQNNPLKGWQESKEPRRQFHLTVEDLKKIHANAAPHLQWALEVQWNLGTRPGPSELLSLQWENVDFEKNRVNVFGRKTRDWRSIPISEEFKNRLLARKAEAKTDFVIEYQGRQVKKFRRAFGTAVKAAGIEYPCRMYDTRHLFATILLNGGADLAAVSKLLGHHSTQMTVDTYLELLAGEKERAVSLLPSITSPDEGENTKAESPKVIPFRRVSK